MAPETTWTLRFSFAMWRIKGGSIDERELHITRPGLSDAKLREWMDAIESETLLRVKVRFPARQKEGWMAAELVQMVGIDTSDGELNAKAVEWRKPVKVRRPNLGTFTLNRRFNEYEANIIWVSKRVRLALRRDGTDDEAVFVAAQALCKAQRTWDNRVRAFAAKELMTDVYDDWLESHGKRLTRRAFEAQMKLGGIALSADGGFEFWFDDGDMFGGHAIMVSGTLTDGPTDAGIHG